MAAPKPRTGHAQGFSSPQEEAMLHLLRSADRLQRSLEQSLKPSGLTATQFNVLRILRANPAGLTCSAIGRGMLTQEPDITRLLARLKSQSLVAQRRSTEDRRQTLTCLTQAGEAILAKLDGIVEQAPKDMLWNLSAEELRELTRLLQKASAANLHSVCPGDAGLKYLIATGRMPGPGRLGRAAPRTRTSAKPPRWPRWWRRPHRPE